MQGAYSYIPKWVDIVSLCVCMENVEELEFNARQDAHLIELVQPNWGQW